MNSLSGIHISFVGLLILLPRFIAQAYAISLNGPGSEYLLFAIGLSSFAPYITGLLSARLTDSFARGPVNGIPSGSLIAYHSFIYYTIFSVALLSILSVLRVGELINAASVGFLVGLSNQVISLQQIYFVRERRVGLLGLQQFFLLILSALMCFAVVKWNVDILLAMAVANTSASIIILLLGSLSSGYRIRSVSIRRFASMVKYSLFPLVYIACSLCFVAFISADRMVADFMFGVESKKYFFIVNCYIVFITMTARYLRFQDNWVPVLIFLNALLLAFGVTLWIYSQYFGEVVFFDEYWKIWALPSTLLLSWKAFHEHRNKRLYVRSVFLFGGLSLLKLISYYSVAIGYFLYDEFFTMQCWAFLFAIILFLELRKYGYFTFARNCY
ncbi:hypothetical protein N9I87_02695 [Gammaproteobacteria bacterium]|nr:hypothetical protein [Gammaproteobacteria bacterium]